MQALQLSNGLWILAGRLVGGLLTQREGSCHCHCSGDGADERVLQPPAPGPAARSLWARGVEGHPVPALPCPRFGARGRRRGDRVGLRPGRPRGHGGHHPAQQAQPGCGALHDRRLGRQGQRRDRAERGGAATSRTASSSCWS